MIRLRELTAEDLPRILGWRGSRELYQWLGGDFRGSTLEQERAWFAAYELRRGRDRRFAICLAESGEHIGNLYMLEVEGKLDSAQFHIFIAEPAYRGKGYGEAATRAALALAFGQLGLTRVELEVLEDNGPAIALYEKCSFRREGFRDGRKDGRAVRLIRMAAQAR